MRGAPKRRRNAGKLTDDALHGYGGLSDDGWLVASNEEGGSSQASDASTGSSDDQSQPDAAAFTHAGLDRAMREAAEAVAQDRGMGICTSLGLRPGGALPLRDNMHLYALFLLLQMVYPGTLPVLRGLAQCPDAQLYRQVWKAVEEPLASRREALFHSSVWSPALRKLVHTLPRLRVLTTEPTDALYIRDPVLQDKFTRDLLASPHVAAAVAAGHPPPAPLHGLSNKCGVCRRRGGHPSRVTLTFFGRRLPPGGLADDINATSSTGSSVLGVHASQRKRLARQVRARGQAAAAQATRAVAAVLPGRTVAGVGPSGGGGSDSDASWTDVVLADPRRPSARVVIPLAKGAGEVRCVPGWEAELPRGPQSATLQPGAPATAQGQAFYAVVAPPSYTPSSDSDSDGDASASSGSASGGRPRRRRLTGAEASGQHLLQEGIPRQCLPRWIAAGRMCCQRLRAYHATYHFKYKLCADIARTLHDFACELEEGAAGAAATAPAAPAASTPQLHRALLASEPACRRLEQVARTVKQAFLPTLPDTPPPPPAPGYEVFPPQAPALAYGDLPPYALPPPPPLAFLLAITHTSAWQALVRRWTAQHEALSRLSNARYATSASEAEGLDAGGPDGGVDEEGLDVLEDALGAEVLPLPVWAAGEGCRPPLDPAEAGLAGALPLRPEGESASPSGEGDAWTRGLTQHPPAVLRLLAACCLDTCPRVRSASLAQATAVLRSSKSEHRSAQGELATALRRGQRALSKWEAAATAYQVFREHCLEAQQLLAGGSMLSPAQATAAVRQAILTLSSSDSGSDDEGGSASDEGGVDAPAAWAATRARRHTLSASKRRRAHRKAREESRVGAASPPPTPPRATRGTKRHRRPVAAAVTPPGAGGVEEVSTDDDTPLADLIKRRRPPSPASPGGSDASSWASLLLPPSKLVVHPPPAAPERPHTAQHSLGVSRAPDTFSLLTLDAGAGVQLLGSQAERAMRRPTSPTSASSGAPSPQSTL